MYLHSAGFYLSICAMCARGAADGVSAEMSFDEAVQTASSVRANRHICSKPGFDQSELFYQKILILLGQYNFPGKSPHNQGIKKDE